MNTFKRDAFQLGLLSDFQVLVTIEPSVSSKTIELTDMVRRLELAGIGEKSSTKYVCQSGLTGALPDVVQPTGEPSDVSSDVPSDVVQSFEGHYFREEDVLEVVGESRVPDVFVMSVGIQIICPHSQDCYRCLKLGHVARYCTASEPVRKVVVETTYDFEGQISNLTTAQLTWANFG